MKEYVVKKVADKNLAVNSPVWEQVESLQIDCFPWEGYCETVKASAKAVYSEYGITVRFETNDRPLYAIQNKENSDVYRDSCVEFFFRPEEEERYINLEINPLGALYTAFGYWQDKDRNVVEVNKKDFQLVSYIEWDKWYLQVTVPFYFWEQYFGKMPKEFRANFYKCGDDTCHQHYQCWNPIEWEQPKFHLPQFFGKLILEEKE